MGRNSRSSPAFSLPLAMHFPFAILKPFPSITSSLPRRSCNNIQAINHFRSCSALVIGILGSFLLSPSLAMHSRIILILILFQILHYFCLGILSPTPKITIGTILPRQAPASSTITVPPAQILQLNSACLVLGEALSICQSATPDFTDLDETAQAGCLCYSGIDWQPTVFDSAVAGCANFAATAVGGTVENVIQDLVGFCESVGNIVQFTTVSGPGSNVAEE